MSAKYIIHTLERQQIAMKFVPDDNQNWDMGTVGLGGFSRNMFLYRRLAEEAFGKQKLRAPVFVQRNKCWVTFRAKYSEFCEAIHKLEEAHMVLQAVRGFGTLVR